MWHSARNRPGESGRFEFPGDGKWHSSPVVAHYDDRLRIRRVGVGLALPKAAVEFRIGLMPQIVNEGQDFRVTNPGQIYFRLNRGRVPGYSGKVEVEVARTDRPSPRPIR